MRTPERDLHKRVGYLEAIPALTIFAGKWIAAFAGLAGLLDLYFGWLSGKPNSGFEISFLVAGVAFAVAPVVDSLSKRAFYRRVADRGLSAEERAELKSSAESDGR